MSGNGAGTVTQPTTDQTPRIRWVRPQVRLVFCGAARGTAALTAVVLRSVTTAARPTVSTT